jgi:integrase
MEMTVESYLAAVRPIPWAEFTAEFLLEYKPPLAARKTQMKMRHIVKAIGALGVETTADLTPDMLTRFVASRPPGQSAYTLRGLLMAAKVACNYAEAHRYLVLSPFRVRPIHRLVRVPPLTGQRSNSREEVRRILDLMAADVAAARGWEAFRCRRLLALTSLVAYTGARAGEALNSWVTDLDIPNRIFHVRPHGAGARLKTAGAEAPIGMPPALCEILEAWLKHRLDAPPGFAMPDCPWLIPSVRRVGPWRQSSPFHRPVDKLQAVARRAGVAYTSYQVLRRSWATIAVGLGVPLPVVSRQLRHSSTQVTAAFYLSRDLAAVRDATANFEF